MFEGVIAAHLSEKRVKCSIEEENLSLRRGILVVLGGAFERLFCPEGREFEQANLQKFKCPGGCPGGGC